MELAYGGLHQLCAPDAGSPRRAARAPTSVSTATVFGLNAGPAPDPFVVQARHVETDRNGRRAATTHVCRRRRAVARSALPAQVLGFVAPHVVAEHVAIVCAAHR